MKRFSIRFFSLVSDDTSELEFQLEDTELANEWLESALLGVNSFQSAGEYSPIRIERLWSALRRAMHDANQDHLLDEWIHLPTELPEDYQPLFNELRSRAYSFEIYARANNQQSETRSGLQRVMYCIDCLEYTLRKTGEIFTKFEVSNELQVSTDQLQDSVDPGTISCAVPYQRTLAEACLSNDLDIVKRKLVRPWNGITAVSVFSLTRLNYQNVNTEQWLSDNQLNLNNGEYFKTFSKPVARLLNTPTQEQVTLVSRLRVKEIVQ